MCAKMQEITDPDKSFHGESAYTDPSDPENDSKYSGTMFVTIETPKKTDTGKAPYSPSTNLAKMFRPKKDMHPADSTTAGGVKVDVP